MAPDHPSLIRKHGRQQRLRRYGLSMKELVERAEREAASATVHSTPLSVKHLFALDIFDDFLDRTRPTMDGTIHESVDSWIEAGLRLPPKAIIESLLFFYVDGAEGKTSPCVLPAQVHRFLTDLSGGIGRRLNSIIRMAEREDGKERCDHVIAERNLTRGRLTRAQLTKDTVDSILEVS